MLPFSLDHCIFITIPAQNNKSENFFVELILDVASVNDGKPAIDGSPQFDVSLQFSSTIAPASTNENITPLPAIFPQKLNIKTKSSFDKKTYEMSLEATILKLELTDNIDTTSEIPGVTLECSISSSSSTPIEEEVAATFNCVYCGYRHPISWNTDEHIIPRALKNENYVLSKACRRLNNYMAHSFEKKVLDFDIIKYIKLLLFPPDKPTYFGEVKTTSDRKVFSYILPSGDHELTEHPIYTQKNIIELPIKADLDELIQYKLTLPFSYKAGVTGSPRMVKDRNRIIGQEKNKINKYLKEISENPSINQEFDEFLKEVKGQYIFKPIDIKEEARPENPPIILSEVPKQSITIDNEVLFKLFFKIAWTHAVKQLGMEQLSNPVSNWILKYLTTGHMINPELIKENPDLFANPVKIEDKEYIFWKYGLDETLGRIEQIKDKTLKADLMRYHLYRHQQFNLAEQFIAFDCISNFDPELIARISEFRFHNINIKTDNFLGGNVSVCHIRLFGGIFDVKIKLSEKPLVETYPPDIRIEF